MKASPRGAGGVPSTAELLEAVEECLREDLLPKAAGRERYLMQVCVAAVALAGRDLGGAAEVQVAREESLAMLGVADAKTLIAEIRAGLDPARFAQVAAALAAVNEAEMAVLRPE